MKKVVGQVSELEKREIQILFERRNGLNELAKILTADNTELYERKNINGKALMVEIGRLILTHVKFIL